MDGGKRSNKSSILLAGFTRIVIHRVINKDVY